MLEVIQNNQGNHTPATPAIMQMPMNQFNQQPQQRFLSPLEIAGKVNDCIEHLDVSPASKGTYKRALAHFVKWIEERQTGEDMELLQEHDILQYKEALRSSEFSNYTSNNYLAAVKRFFKWLNQTGQYPNITLNVKGFKKSKGYKKDTMNEEQIADVLGVIDRTTLRGKRDYAILAILVTTGARTIEIVRSNVEDMRSQEGEHVLYVQGKGRDDKDEFIVLIPEVKAAIDDYLTARGSSKEKEALFISVARRNYGDPMTTRSISRLVKDYLKEAGIDNRRLTAHSFRHTAITNALAAGASIQEVQQMARHASINTTMVYAQNINRIKSAPEKRLGRFLG